MLMRAIEGVLHRTLVGLVILDDALLHLVDLELAGIDRFSGVEDAPDETDALCGLGAGYRRPGPRSGKKRGVDVQDRPVGIDVAAREARGDQRGALVRAGRVELVDVAVLGLAQQLDRNGAAEVVG